MPNLDRTGPLGQGAMTGGRRGSCRTNRTEQSSNNSDASREITQNIKSNEVGLGLQNGKGRAHRFRGGDGTNGRRNRRGYGWK